MLIGYDLDIVFGSGKAEGQCLPVADLDLIHIHLDAAVLAVMAFYIVVFRAPIDRFDSWIAAITPALS